MAKRFSRRGFLAALAAAVAGAAVTAVDPERLLWTPGQKTHFLPPPAGWKPQDLSFEEFYAQYVRDAAQKMADKIDRQLILGFDPAHGPDQSILVEHRVRYPEKFTHFYDGRPISPAGYGSYEAYAAAVQQQQIMNQLRTIEREIVAAHSLPPIYMLRDWPAHVSKDTVFLVNRDALNLQKIGVMRSAEPDVKG